MPGFKDILNLIAGELLAGNGYAPDVFASQIQLMICMIGSNPFIG